MEFKEIDINAPIIHHLKHLDDTIKQRENEINNLQNQINNLQNQIKQKEEENINLQNQLMKIKNHPIIKILLKTRRICLNFLGKNK